MDRNYTIHEHDGVKFINLSGRDIVTECGSEYPPEMTEYVVTNESREDAKQHKKWDALECRAVQ